MTLCALGIKHWPDKRWILYHLKIRAKNHSRNFALHLAVGQIRQATPTDDWMIWQSDIMGEIGAFVGLSLGSILKYPLDRRFVFNHVYKNTIIYFASGSDHVR